MTDDAVRAWVVESNRLVFGPMGAVEESRKRRLWHNSSGDRERGERERERREEKEEKRGADRRRFYISATATRREDRAPKNQRNQK